MKKKLNYIFVWVIAFIACVCASLWIYRDYLPYKYRTIGMVYAVLFIFLISVSFAEFFKIYREDNQHKKFCLCFFVAILSYIGINLLVKYIWF